MAIIKVANSRKLRQLWYLPVLSLAMGLMMVRVLVIAKLLDVPNFAEFSAAQLLSSTFCMLGALGLQSLLQREMPIQFVRGRDRAATVLLMQSLIVALGCAAVGWMFAMWNIQIAGLSQSMICIAILHGLSQQWFLLTTVESRSRGQPLFFAGQTFLRAVLVLAVGVTAGWGLNSATAVMISEAVVSISLTLAMLPGLLQRAKMTLVVAVRLAIVWMPMLPWKTAFSLLLLMSLTFLLMNIDRWFAAELLSPRLFAIYSFAWVILAIAQSLQAVINAAAYPWIARKFAQSGRSVAFRITAIVSVALLVVAAILCWPTMYLMKLGIEFWFPEYSEASSIVGILLFVAILRLTDFWSSYLVILGKEKLLLLLNSVVGVVVGAAWMLSVRPWETKVVAIEEITWLAFAFTFASYFVAFSFAYLHRKDSV